MGTPLVRLASAALFATVGLCAFLLLLNRVLILIPDRKAKLPIILLTFITLTGGGALAGTRLARPPWVFVPPTLLTLVLLGELRRASIRRACAGAGPVDTIPHAVSLTTPITTTDLAVHRYAVPLRTWHAPPLRIVHITDLHVHPKLPISYYRNVLNVAAQLQPDIAVFTGDYITRADGIPILREVLRPVARLRDFAVLGNHDYWVDPDTVRRIVRESGLRLLSDETDSLAVGGGTLAVTGHDCPWSPMPHHDLPALDATRLNIVLSHTPDNIYRVSRAGADLMFSGHNHAGQFRLPFVGSVVVPSVYGRRFDHGHFVIDGTHLFVAAGIGSGAPPVRIYCQPDIFVVDVMRDRNRAVTCRAIAYASPDYRATLALRDEVLRRPLGRRLEEDQLRDEDRDHHLAGFIDGRLVACLVLTPHPPDAVRMRQVAVAADCRRDGIGTALVRYAEQFAAEHGYREIVAHARGTAVPFYEQLGYTAVGEPYTEIGLPHITMRKAPLV